MRDSKIVQVIFKNMTLVDQTLLPNSALCFVKKEKKILKDTVK